MQSYREAGKKIFLLTNSGYKFVDAGMRHILEGQLERPEEWRSLFDLICVQADKPNWRALASHATRRCSGVPRSDRAVLPVASPLKLLMALGSLCCGSSAIQLDSIRPALRSPALRCVCHGWPGSRSPAAVQPGTGTKRTGRSGH